MTPKMGSAQIIRRLGETLKDHNTRTGDIKDFLGSMLLPFKEIWGLDQLAFYWVDYYGQFAEPILVIGHGTLDDAVGDKGVNAGLESKFTEYNIPLNDEKQPSRFRTVYNEKKSFFGEDKGVSQLTEVDRRISELFGTNDYMLMTVKGRGDKEGEEKVIGFIYGDYSFTGGDLSQIEKEDETRLIVENIANHLQLVRAYEALQKETEARKEAEKGEIRAYERAEKLYFVNRIIQAIAHEIRNPIMSIGGFAARLKGQLSKNDSKYRYVDIIINETGRLEHFVKQAKELLSPLNPVYNVVNVYDVLEMAVREANGDKQRYIIKGNDDGVIVTDPDILKKAAVNLISNGFEAMRGDESELTITVERNGNDYKDIIIQNPQGIHPTIFPNISDPSYSTKEGKAFGLGLTIAERYAKSIGATILYDTNTKEGQERTTFTLRLPNKQVKQKK